VGIYHRNNITGTFRDRNIHDANNPTRHRKTYYDNNILSDWNNIDCVYIAYIGIHDDKHYLKLGRSYDFPRRDLVEHKKFYKIFNVLKIWKTIANETVEAHMKMNFASKNMLTSLKIKGPDGKIKKKNELVLLNQVNDLEYCISMIDNVVNNTVSPLEQFLRDEVKDLKHKNKHQKELIGQQKELIGQLKVIHFVSRSLRQFK